MSSKAIRYDEYHNLDINWYFVDRHHHLICVASGGGRIPKIIGESISRNDLIHSSVLSSAPLFEPAHNPSLSEYINFSDIDSQQYFSSFDFVASRGFYAFDKVHLSDQEDEKYVLVSYPRRIENSHIYPNSPNLPYLVLSLARLNRRRARDYAKSLVQIPALDLQMIGKNIFDNPPYFDSSVNLIELVNDANVLHI